MKAREFERQFRGWMRGLGHRWTSRMEPDPRYNGARYVQRVMRCADCDAKIVVQRSALFRNFLVPTRRHGPIGLVFSRGLIHLRTPDPGSKKYRYHVAGGVRDPRFPRLVRQLAVPCSEIRVAEAMYFVHGLDLP